MQPSLQLIHASDRETWDAAIAPAPHDVYHTAGYHLLWQARGEPWLAYYGDSSRFVAWPFLLRPIETRPGSGRPEWRDVTSVYGYPGPVSRNCETCPEFAGAAWQALLDAWRQMRVVSVFTRFNPLVENHRWLERLEFHGGGGGLQLLGHTVSMDLRLPEDEALRGYRRSVRVQILRARESGLLTELDAEWAHLDGFVGLLFQTMDRNRAAPEFYLGADFFRRFRQLFPDQLFLHITRVGPQIGSAGMFLEYGGIVHALYVGNDEWGARAAAAKILFDSARAWARARGDTLLHLGGGRNARDDDSLFYFKSGFSPRRHPFYVGSWVLEADAYDALCDRAQALAGAAAHRDYFPAYRHEEALSPK